MERNADLVQALGLSLATVQKPRAAKPSLYRSPLEGINDPFSADYEELEAVQAELDSANWSSVTALAIPQARRAA